MLIMQCMHDWHPAKERTKIAKRRRKIVEAIDQQIKFLANHEYKPTRLAWKPFDQWIDELVEIPTGLQSCSTYDCDGSIFFNPSKNGEIKKFFNTPVRFRNKRDALVFLIKLKEEAESQNLSEKIKDT